MADIYPRANEEFKSRYSKYLGHAVWMAIVVHAVLFLVVPPIKFRPYQLKEDRFEIVEVPADFEIPEAPEAVAMPQMNIEAAADNEPATDAAETPETTFNDFADMPPPPPPGGSSDGSGEQEFVAFDEAPELVEYVTPEYPPLAREAGFEGTVHVRALVDEQGHVIAADILSSDSGVLPEMEKAAVDAAMMCRFKPAKQRTMPVKAHVMIPFIFRLD